MTTTTATTSTPTPTPASTASVTKSAAQSVLTSLSTGSGVDTDSLVTNLVQAQFAAKNAAIAAKTAALTAQISTTSTLKSTIAQFSTALGTLTGGGTLQTQPVSSNASVLGASAIPGAKVGQLSSSITVSALASAQGARSAAVADRTATIATGKLTLTLGTATYNGAGTAMTGFTAGSGTPVSIDVTDGSLDGIASAINAAKSGVTASVITDADGKAVLSLKGTTGAAQAFTLKADDAGSALNQFNVGVNTGTLTGAAANAQLTVDGVSVQRSSNTISDLVSGVKLQLNAVSAGPVSLSSTRPTAALAQAVSDFVDTYNQVYAGAKSATDPITGDLKSDTAAKTLLRSLQSLTTKTLAPGSSAGAPTTLAQLGIATGRDGTLSVNTDTLNKAIAAYPDEVEAMFATTSSNALGLQSSLSGISLAASSSVYGLGASTTRYTKAQSDLTIEQDKITTLSDAMKTRMTQQFSSMNSKVTAYKSTQTFLENQIKAWNKDS
ncbi:flagellar filament capping protein FliD [Sphingomonas sp. RP10(2022)]|uniref:Flagellar hook-associated protein 2 n=1 Tax=Sphingomonas liriopis TaxID=2949094 RepID=A0A9X2HZH3_9SPHN|nr:flagellar filament capping protein FliD [Sphingomonas liriopis]MCP3734970.1 flagellar filament capping protein FliD [Sphingomonas liriopis]